MPRRMLSPRALAVMLVFLAAPPVAWAEEPKGTIRLPESVVGKPTAPLGGRSLFLNVGADGKLFVQEAEMLLSGDRAAAWVAFHVRRGTDHLVLRADRQARAAQVVDLFRETEFGVLEIRVLQPAPKGEVPIEGRLSFTRAEAKPDGLPGLSLAERKSDDGDVEFRLAKPDGKEEVVSKKQLVDRVRASIDKKGELTLKVDARVSWQTFVETLEASHRAGVTAIVLKP